MPLPRKTKVCFRCRIIYAELDLSFSGAFIDQDGKSVLAMYPQSMRCTSTQWVPQHTLKRSARPLIREGFSSAEKILSHDEGGSEFGSCTGVEIRCTYTIDQGLTQRSLQRLSPRDTSMVLIIDDRADVWEWSPNLVKVIPCGSIIRGTCQHIRIY